MHPLAKRIALLFSGFSLVIGLFLLGSNLQFIPGGTVSIALNLWPLLLIVAGIMLVGDSTKKRVSAHASHTSTVEYPLPLQAESTEISLRLHFSYGRLVVGPAAGPPRLITESLDPNAAPAIKSDVVGESNEISIAISQPLFPSLDLMGNAWRLELPPGLPLRLSIQLHEADMRMDLRELHVESIDLHTESGTQEVLLGPPVRKLKGKMYSAGGSLFVVLPARVFALLRLLNPFCRVDFPQGDFEKRQDGSLITPRAGDTRGSVEIDVDGPIGNLVIDIDDSVET